MATLVIALIALAIQLNGLIYLTYTIMLGAAVWWIFTGFQLMRLDLSEDGRKKWRAQFNLCTLIVIAQVIITIADIFLV